MTLAWIDAVAREVCSIKNPVVKKHGNEHAYYMAGIWAQRQVEYLKERLSFDFPAAMRPTQDKLDAWEEENLTADVEVEVAVDYDVRLELWKADRKYIKLEVRGFPR